jgi:hypothetical protein
MARKRMRYQWFQDVPRNVTRREYQRLQFLNFCSIGLGVTATMMAVASLSGLTLKTSRTLDQIDAMTIEAATTYNGDPIDLVQLEGYVVADNPPTMPDNQAQQVIRGKLALSARPEATTGNADQQSPQSAILFAWETATEPVSLSDGTHRIPLGFDLAMLPMEDDLGDASPRILYEGESARTSRPVAIEYGDQIYPLPLDSWGEVDSVFTDIERQVLTQGQSVVVVAGLNTTPQGNQLVDPLGNRLQILIGTEAGIRRQGQQLRVLFLILAFPLGFASFMVGKSAHQLNQAFIERSNENSIA